MESTAPPLQLDAPAVATLPPANSPFVPMSPPTLEAAGLTARELFPLILKFLFLHGNRSGAEISQQCRMQYPLVLPVLEALKSELLIAHKQSAGVSDFEYELTPGGAEKARQHLARSTYCGAAPVSLEAYRQSVQRQSLKHQAPSFADVRRALKSLEVSDLLAAQLGQAISSGRSLFLFGAPGNGKSTFARRAIAAVPDDHLWIPRTITIGGEAIRLYDPSLHQAAPLPQSTGLTREDPVDQRWVRIQRPTIVVGGELEMKHLEATLNPVTGIIEAPVHLKSNCGCLVVDDFGRQRISTTQLLNRWIVPMETGHDYFNLPSGRQVALPFDQFLVFSTNLEPARLCDEAFLRRIPYKIQVPDPTESQFRRLFEHHLERLGFQVEPGTLDDLIEHHYRAVERPFRFCHVTDLIDQCREFCEFHRRPRTFSRDILELAVMNYFSGMSPGGAAPAPAWPVDYDSRAGG